MRGRLRGFGDSILRILNARISPRRLPVIFTAKAARFWSSTEAPPQRVWPRRPKGKRRPTTQSPLLTISGFLRECVFLTMWNQDGRSHRSTSTDIGRPFITAKNMFLASPRIRGRIPLPKNITSIRRIVPFEVRSRDKIATSGLNGPRSAVERQQSARPGILIIRLV